MIDPVVIKVKESIEDQVFNQLRSDPLGFQAFMIDLANLLKKDYLDPPESLSEKEEKEFIEKNNLKLFSEETR